MDDSHDLVSAGLRDYQIRGLDMLRDSYRSGHRAPLFVLPTAGGKTIIFRQAAKLAALRDRRTLVVVHRRELLKQASNKLAEAEVGHGIIAAGFAPDCKAMVQVCSIQTAIRRDIGEFGFLIFDEGHHCVAATWRQLIASQPDAFVLGVTATPSRLDGRGLGKDHGGIFDDLIIGATVGELTAAGWLCPARVFVAKTKLDLRSVSVIAGDYHKGQLEHMVLAADIAGDAVAEYRKRADHLAAVAFTVSIAHAMATAEAFSRAGYRAAAVHGEMQTTERDARVAGLASGTIEVLTSCEILGEGIDVPAIGCAILLRPTRSLAVYLQQVGRGLRPAPGKPHLIVLDLAGNSLAHGLPDEPRHWTLAGAPKRKIGQQPGWICANCECLNPMHEAVCIDCGEPRPQRERELTVNPNDELVELQRRKYDRIAALSYRALLSRPRTRAELEIYQRAHGYKPGWIWRTQQEMAETFGGAQ